MRNIKGRYITYFDLVGELHGVGPTPRVRNEALCFDLAMWWGSQTNKSAMGTINRLLRDSLTVS